MEKTTIVLVTKPPYGSAVSAEAFRSAMGLPTVNICTKVLLIGDGVLSLIKGAKPKETFDFGHMGEAFLMGDDFDFTTWVHLESVLERGLTMDDLMECKSVNNEQVDSMLREADTILRF